MNFDRVKEEFMTNLSKKSTVHGQKHLALGMLLLLFKAELNPSSSQ